MFNVFKKSSTIPSKILFVIANVSLFNLLVMVIYLETELKNSSKKNYKF